MWSSSFCSRWSKAITWINSITETSIWFREISISIKRRLILYFINIYSMIWSFLHLGLEFLQGMLMYDTIHRRTMGELTIHPWLTVRNRLLIIIIHFIIIDQFRENQIEVLPLILLPWWKNFKLRTIRNSSQFKMILLQLQLTPSKYQIIFYLQGLCD